MKDAQEPDNTAWQGCTWGIVAMLVIVFALWVRVTFFN